MPEHCDYITAGSGIAGLYAATLASERGAVLVLTKRRIDDCTPRLTQGGITAPTGVLNKPHDLRVRAA